jgi:Cyanate permease
MSSSDQSSGKRLSPALSPSSVQALGGSWLLVLGIVLLSLILRAPITAVGPIVAQIQGTFGLSGALTGLLTTLPLIAFGLCSPAAPRIAARIGTERALLGASVVLAAAIAVRSLPDVFALFAGTALLGAAIAIANVLLPSLVKREYPQRVGLMTGVYTVAMNLGAAVGSGLSVPLTEELGVSWQGMLALMALVSLAAAAVWVPLLRGASGKRRAMEQQETESGRQGGAARSVWRSPLAWLVSIYLALQSFCFYVNVTWIPNILADKGLNHEDAGWMLALMQLVSMLSTFIVPIAAGKQKSQSGLSALLASLFVIGYAGLWLGGTGLILPMMIVLGLGVGGGFSLAVMFFALRSRTSRESAELSGMAQTVGYLIAAAGPFLFGALHDWTGSWNAPLLAIIVVSVLYGIVGLYAGADRKV